MGVRLERRSLLICSSIDQSLFRMRVVFHALRAKTTRPALTFSRVIPDERGKINALLGTCARDYESTRKNRPWQNAQSGFSKHKSENQLQRKLNQTFRRSDAALYRAGYLTEPVTVRPSRGAIEACSRGRKIRVVE